MANFVKTAVIAAGFVAVAGAAQAALLTDPNDPRTWQGASVGTFATLFYGSNTLANRQLVIDNKLLDDGVFNAAAGTAAPLIQSTGIIAGGGRSLDLTGTGSYAYTTPSGLGVVGAASSVDEHWVQTDNVVGHAIWDLGAPASRAAIFNTIDHGPLPGEAIESTVYLSNDKITWVEAETQRVWLEGFQSNTGILWDGFAYVVGTPTDDLFRYASIIHGGPGAIIKDGDNEINGVLGLDVNFDPVTPSGVPEPATLALLGAALAGLGFARRRRSA